MTAAGGRTHEAADGLVMRVIPVALAVAALSMLATIRWEVALFTLVTLAVVAVLLLRSLLVFTLVGVVVATAVGLLAAHDAALAAAVTIALILAVVIGVRGDLMPPLMVVAVFIEGLQVGGYALTFILAPIALVFLVSELSAGRAALPAGRLSMWLAGYGLWALASALWTDHFGDTVTALLALLVAAVYFLAFGGLVRDTDDVVRVLWGVAAGASLTGLVAVGQFVVTGDRAVGLQGDPNYFAAYQIVAVPVLLVLTNTVSGRIPRALATAALLITFGSILTSLSRGGLLALGLVTVVALLVPSRFLFGSGRRRMATVGALLTSGVLLFTVVSDAFLPRLQEGFGAQRTESAGAGRVNEWRAAWTSIQDEPLLGIGLGSFVPASNDLLLRTPGVDFTNFRLDPEGLEAHNAYISSAAELGIPGLLLFCGALLAAGASLVGSARRARDALTRRVAAALAVSLAGWAVTSLFLSSEGARPLWMLFGLSAALAGIVARGGTAADGSPARAAIPAPFAGA